MYQPELILSFSISIHSISISRSVFEILLSMRYGPILTKNETFLWINMLCTKISQILCRLRKSMLIGLKVSSLVLRLHNNGLYYWEPTKCSKWILNTINRPNMLTDQIICSLCFVCRPSTSIIRSID